MAAAFTESEKAQIKQALLAAAARHAGAEGMKRVSVDTLAMECGISKGAFYHFYESKELLFLEMLELHYQKIAEQAAQACRERTGLSPVERASQVFKIALGSMDDAAMMHFVQHEVPMLLRRIPLEVQQEHFHSIEDFIVHLLGLVNCRLRVERDVAIDIIRILFMSLLNADVIGPGFPVALAAMVDSICAQLIENDQNN